MSSAPPLLFDKPYFRRLLQGAALLLFITCCLGIFMNASNDVPDDIDFLTLMASPRSALDGGGLFRPFVYLRGQGGILFTQTPSQFDHQTFSQNLNPPAVSLLLLPLAKLELRTAYYILCYLQLIAALVVLWRILAHILPQRAMPFWLAMAVISGYFPVTANMLLGQIGLLPFITLGLFWLALERHQMRRAGLWLGVAVTLKLFVGLLFVWIFLQRRWSVVLYGLGSAAMLLLLSLSVFGVQNHIDWIHALQQMNWGAENWNASLSGLFRRAFGEQSSLTLPLIKALAFMFASLGLLWLNAQTQKLGTEKTLALGLALCGPLMLLLTPLGWIYYFPLLLWSSALLWRESAALVHPAKLRSLLAVSLILSGTPQLMGSATSTHKAIWQSFDSGVQFTQNTNGQLVQSYTQSFSWFVLPEIYTVALLLLALLPFWLAYTAKSAQTGT